MTLDKELESFQIYIRMEVEPFVPLMRLLFTLKEFELLTNGIVNVKKIVRPGKKNVCNIIDLF